MNADRRKALAAITERVADAQRTLEGIHSDLEDIRQEEEEYLENMPDSLRYTDRGDVAQQAIDEMTTALEMLDEMASQDVSSPLGEASA